MNRSFGLFLFIAFAAISLFAQTPATVTCPVGLRAGGPTGTYTVTLTSAVDSEGADGDARLRQYRCGYGSGERSDFGRGDVIHVSGDASRGWKRRCRGNGRPLATGLQCNGCCCCSSGTRCRANIEHHGPGDDGAATRGDRVDRVAPAVTRGASEGSRECSGRRVARVSRMASCSRTGPNPDRYTVASPSSSSASSSSHGGRSLIRIQRIPNGRSSSTIAGSRPSFVAKAIL